MKSIDEAYARITKIKAKYGILSKTAGKKYTGVDLAEIKSSRDQPSGQEPHSQVLLAQKPQVASDKP